MNIICLKRYFFLNSFFFYCVCHFTPTGLITLHSGIFEKQYVWVSWVIKMPYFQNGFCVIPKKAPSVGGMLVFVTEHVVASIFSVIFHFLSILSLNLTLLHPSLFALLPFALLSWCTFFCPLLELLVILLRALQYWSCFWALVHSAGTSTTQHTTTVSTCLLLQRSHAVDSLKVTQEICSGSSVISYYWLLFLSFENIGAGAAGTDFCFYSKCMGHLHQEEALISQLWMFCPSRE